MLQEGSAWGLRCHGFDMTLLSRHTVFDGIRPALGGTVSGIFLGQDVDDQSAFKLRTKDLRTHGVVLGMTGSGKTGLCMVHHSPCLLT